MRPLKLQWSETEDKKKIPNTYMYEVLSLNILIMKRREGVCLKKYGIKTRFMEFRQTKFTKGAEL